MPNLTRPPKSLLCGYAVFALGAAMWVATIVLIGSMVAGKVLQ